MFVTKNDKMNTLYVPCCLLASVGISFCTCKCCSSCCE